MKPENINEYKATILNLMQMDFMGLFDDWLLDVIAGKTEDEIEIDFTNTLAEHYYWLRIAEQQEDYTLCHNILKCIDIEEKTLLRVIKKYTNFSNDLYLSIQDIRKELNIIYNQNEDED